MAKKKTRRTAAKKTSSPKKPLAKKKAAASKSQRSKSKPLRRKAKKAAVGGSSGDKEFVAFGTAANCVPASKAGPLVMGCAGQDFNVQTTLGQAFPSPVKREQFCRCVSDRSGVGGHLIPCSPDNTFLDVIVSISC